MLFPLRCLFFFAAHVFQPHDVARDGKLAQGTIILAVTLRSDDGDGKGNATKTIVGLHMTSLKFKLKNYWSYQDFTFTMH